MAAQEWFGGMTLSLQKQAETSQPPPIGTFVADLQLHAKHAYLLDSAAHSPFFPAGTHTKEMFALPSLSKLAWFSVKLNKLLSAQHAQ